MFKVKIFFSLKKNILTVNTWLQLTIKSFEIK